MTHSCTPGAHGREHQRQCLLQRKDDDEQTISDPIAKNYQNHIFSEYLSQFRSAVKTLI